VSIHLSGDPGDPGQPKTRLGRVDGSEAGAERRLVRDGVQVLGHGALVCPECALPLAVGGRIRAGLAVRCGFCDHTAPARKFVREDVYDTVANEVYLVARVS
jgi:coenzyme F420-reducing hydrogenase gamma subunit